MAARALRSEGATGLTRMFRGDFATEVSWLLPAALLALLLGLWLTRRAPRTDASRAALIVFGGGLLATGLTFSYMQGTIHPYYTVALAPLIAGVLAVTGRLLWSARSTWTGRVGAAALVLVTVVWDAHLLALHSTFPALGRLVLVAGALAAAALLAGPWLRKGVVVAVLVAVLAAVGGSGAYALDTAAQAHTGSIPSSGPVASQLGGGTGGMGGTPPSRPGSTTASSTTAGATTASSTTAGSTTASSPGNQGGGGNAADSALTALLQTSTTRWAAATVGSQSAAPLELASGQAVMAIGGFTGSDAAPTLAQFQAYVAAGRIHYFVSGGNGGGGGQGGTSSTGSQIATWVAAHYQATTVGSSTVYDLTATAS